jgi:hypothetical protein
MKIRWQGQPKKNVDMILEEAGYHAFIDPNTGKQSFVLRLGTRFYPRYHVYINRYTAEGGEIDIHVDQKHVSYEGQRAHSGEYDGPLVEEEAARIQRWVEYYRA